jgi:hypothetical protein
MRVFFGGDALISWTGNRRRKIVAGLAYRFTRVAPGGNAKWQLLQPARPNSTKRN